MDGEIILVDEVLTRLFALLARRVVAWREPPSFDKQFVRDYLKTLTGIDAASRS